MRYLWLCLALFNLLIINTSSGLAKGNGGEKSNLTYLHSIRHIKGKRDTVAKDTVLRDSINLVKRRTIYDRLADSVKIDPSAIATFPGISLQQLLKGKSAGLYVQEQTGEPGTIQNMFIRGAPMPLLSQKELYMSQPLVVLDGIPLITEHPFAFDIQQYDFNRPGPATNIFAAIDMNNIASVEVLKDLAATAVYGPRAVNGVIVLTSKSPVNARSISFSTYIGLAQRPGVTTINGKYENAFRQRFYDLYTTNGRYSDDENYPIYLSDSLNNAYSGKSDWSDRYYRNAIIYGVNLGISGGTDKANFRFSLGNTKNEGVADQTGIQRYSAMFNINMKPLPWLVFSAMVNANRLDRQRNRTLRDRFTQMNYFPDLSAPPPPNKDYYGQYVDQFAKGFDDNKTNVIDGYARLSVELGKFHYSTTFLVDYNEGYRDVFYARTLLQGNSYASNYYGYNQRVMINNKASYDLTAGKLSDFHFEVGQSTQWDTYKYDNAYAYKGTNDYIKINLLDSNPKNPDGSDNGNYLFPTAFPRELTYRFLDKTRDNLVSVYGKADYTFNKKYTLSATIRGDGSSNAQPTSRWFYSPVLAAAWSLKNEFFKNSNGINDLILRASAGRMGRINSYDNYAQGPQYTASVGYTGNLTVPGYNAFSVLTRPYQTGWIGYGIPWSYSNQLDFGIDAGLLKNRLHLSLDYYSKTEKNMLLGIPAFAEYGYNESIESGMSVVNAGVDLTIRGDIVKSRNFAWTSTLNVNYNKNHLKSLPRGLQEITLGDRYLKVGQPVDQYWLLQNEGIYNSEAEVPAGRKYNGIAMHAGDPRWKDVNGDNNIDNNDKVLKGHMLPISSGGFDNNFKYRNWDLGISLYFNLGRNLMNQEMANRFDFINREGNSNLTSVKEVTYWEKRGDYSKYPLYNPWSTVIPYRIDQDLFLENASFVKVRTIQLGYDLTQFLKHRNVQLSRLYIYTAVNNAFTFTKYTGQDPELVDYTGYDTGYGQPIPRTYTLGVKVDF